MFISLLSIWVTSPMHHYLLLVFVHLPRIINTNLHMEAYLCRSWLPSSSVCVLKWHKWPESCPPVRPAWWERRTEGPARHPWRKDACLLPPPPHPRVFLERSLFRIHWSRPARWSSTAPRRSTSWQERGIIDGRERVSEQVVWGLEPIWRERVCSMRSSLPSGKENERKANNKEGKSLAGRPHERKVEQWKVYGVADCRKNTRYEMRQNRSE